MRGRCRLIHRRGCVVSRVHRIGIVCSLFNSEITDAMLRRALERAKEKGLKVGEIVRVPGAFEIPQVLARLLRRKDIDGVVALGAVVKGDTDHDQAIMYSVLPKLLDLSIEHDKPVGLGIAGPGMTWEQATARVDYGERAVDAVATILALEGSASKVRGS